MSKYGQRAFPVYPRHEGSAYSQVHDQLGMMLRDYFAGKALSGMTADPNICMSQDEMARWSYGMADAMLKERENGKEEEV